MNMRICWGRIGAFFVLAALAITQTSAQLTYTPYAFTNFAGQPGGPGVADGSGRGARFRGPSGVAADAAGNLYVADQANFTIRKITPDGTVTTIAGAPFQPGTNDNIGSAARFGSIYGGPEGIAVDSNTNIYVADTLNYTVRKITFVGTNWQVTTLAGTGGFNGTNDNTGAAARFAGPTAVAADTLGNVFVTDGDAVRRINSAGVVATIAGSASQSGSLDASNGVARFNGPKGIAIINNTNIYVTDTYNYTIRKVTLIGNDWVVSTPAGTAGFGGFSDGTNSAASFFDSYGAAFDNAGNLYVSDSPAETIRKITFSGTNAIVSTIAGTPSVFGAVDGTNTAALFQTPEGLAGDSSGNIYVADFGNDEIRKMTPSGTNWITSTLAGEFGGPGMLDGTGNAAQFDIPNGLAIDASSNLYVGDTFNHIIRKITPAGVVTTIAGSPGNHGYADGVGTAQAPRFSNPLGLSFDSNSNLFVADSQNDTIRKIAPDGTVTTFAGQAGVAGSLNLTGTNATFAIPSSTAVDSHGNVFVSDTQNRTIRKITPAGVASLFAGSTGVQNTNDGVGTAAKFMAPEGLTIDSSDNLYLADEGGDTIRKILPDGTVSTLAGLGKKSGTNDDVGSAARFNNPQGVAVDKAGNVYVADTGNNTVRMITPGGSVSTLAGLAGQSGEVDNTNSAARFNGPRGIAVDSQINIYVGDNNSSTIRKLVINGAICTVTTLAGTAGQSGAIDATGPGASFHFVTGLAVDANGNLFAADKGNQTIRKITPAGVVTTFAGLAGTAGSTDGAGGGALFYGPEDLTVDPAGNIYVVEFFNNTVRKIAPNGTNWIVTTLAGSPTNAPGTNDGVGPAAQFSSAFGMARDSAGNLYVAEPNSRTIRKLTFNGSAWAVSTYIGAPNTPGDVDATGTSARLFGAHDIAVDSSDNLYISDGFVIKKITPAAAVTTIASCPPPGNCPDILGAVDGIGSNARFNTPRGLAVDHAGNIYVSDYANELIRKISPSSGNWTVTTLGGSNGQASVKDGVGIDARFNGPNGIAVDSGGSIYVVNSQENSVMKGTLATSSSSPTVQFNTAPGSLTLSGGSFHMQVTSSSSSGSVVVEVSSNLQTWTPVQTDSLSGTPITVTIPVTTAPNQFYRAYVVP